MKYGFLLKPNANLPYFEEMQRMAEAELRMILQQLHVQVTDISTKHIGRGVFLMVEGEELHKGTYKHLTRLSFFYVVFEIKDQVFVPMDIPLPDYFPEDLSVRLKYNGKTNEAFTRLLMNAALYNSAYYNVDKILMLDPVCGKGTGLFEGLIQGYEVYGADINKNHVEDMFSFFLRYLKEGRFKHEGKRSKAMVGSKQIGEMYEAKASNDKDAYKKMKQPNYKVFRGDTRVVNQVFKKNSMHMICGDLPYGVQHKGKADTDATRDLQKWLAMSFKSWYDLLKKNGTIALAWNTYTNTREELAELLQEAGFEVLSQPDLLKFHHRVSQAINRDIIVGIKK